MSIYKETCKSYNALIITNNENKNFGIISNLHKSASLGGRKKEKEEEKIH